MFSVVCSALRLAAGRCIVAGSRVHVVSRWHLTQLRSFSTVDPGAGSSTPLTASAVTKEVDAINEAFGLARDEIEMALESAGTTYFNDEATEATRLGTEVITRFTALLSNVDVEKRGELRRSLGLKMEQLKAELQSLRDAGVD